MKKYLLAVMAVATFVVAGCSKQEPQDIKEVIARYNDTIVMHMLMPGHTTYSVTIDNKANGIVAHDTVFVGCIGETILHITADNTARKDVKLTVIPRLPEEYMFTLPNLDWTRNRADLTKELGDPDNRVGNLPDSCYIYYSMDAAEPFIFYYFDGENYDTLNEIMVSISESDTLHGSILKLFIAERFPFFGKYNGNPSVWEYLDAPERVDATTRALYYRKSGWNVSFQPYSYRK